MKLIVFASVIGLAVMTYAGLTRSAVVKEGEPELTHHQEGPDHPKDETTDEEGK